MSGFPCARERITVHELDETLVSRLARDLAVPNAAARILAGRNLIDPEVCKKYFEPSLRDLHDPFLFGDMDKAVGRILDAVAQNERIEVYGDYDVDGVSGTALLVRVLKILGARCGYYLPHRLTEGYGVSESGVRHIAENGARLLVTVDCGVTAVEEIASANRCGIDCIVTDHHEPKHELPPAVALLDPKIPSCPYPDKDLAGVGVVFKLCQALGARTGRGSTFWEPFLDLVALGTAADIVPLTGENRILARFGFRQMTTTANKGLAALIELQGLAGKPVTTRDVVFQLAPCINAGGRLGDPRRGVDLLLADDDVTALAYARELRTANYERRSIDNAVWNEACAWVEKHCKPEHDFAIVTGNASWHPGVIGIVASKLVERFHRPAILFSVSDDGMARGSGRSIEAVHLLETLSECADLLSSFGGHKAAAGMNIKSSSIDAFRRRFNEAVKKRVTGEDLVPHITADAEVSLSALNEAFFSFVKSMEPFGPGNMRPVLYCRNLRHSRTPRVVGANHLKMAFSGDGRVMDAIAFNFAPRLQELCGASAVSLAFSLDENVWNGRTTLQMNIKGISL